jgi:hypothetical protein
MAAALLAGITIRMEARGEDPLAAIITARPTAAAASIAAINPLPMTDIAETGR